MYASKQAKAINLTKNGYPKRRILRNGQVDRPGVRSQDSGTDMMEDRVRPLGSVEIANIMIHDDDDDDDDDGWDE
ncbi:hypothetical protein BPAE_0033g00220 [Botrytis paeoniae]|uniref:Uncharacterized protein n=1 Tax=Botrytis paeoniae TaxID=278948 RepID=A0A4Z1FXM1_9HELO|nr:hypothetical protein BPAE_0033g00220 [Botrytis paeoniae]